MGMSASQARLLALQAKQSDLEFQGQQINQSRTTLSDQTNNLYAQLQNMDVPTPPVTSDFTTIVYRTNSKDATSYTLGNIRPSAKQDNAYNVDLMFSTVGDSLQKSTTASSVGKAAPTIGVTKVEPTPNGDYINAYVEGVEPEFYLSKNEENIPGTKLRQTYEEEKEDNPALKEAEFLKNYAMISGGNFVAAGNTIDDNAEYRTKFTADELRKENQNIEKDYTGYVEAKGITISANNLSNYLVKRGDTVERLTPEHSCLIENADGSYTVDLGSGYEVYLEGGEERIPNPDDSELLIGGNRAYTYQEARDNFSDTEINWNDFHKGIKNMFGDDAELEDFYYVITRSKSGALDVELFPQDLVNLNKDGQGGTVHGYTYTTGEYTESKNTDYVELEFDTSGRIIKITIPTEYDADGKPVKWQTLDVTASTETDNLAYEQAMNEYEHEKFLYDKEQTKINAQMSLIQSQDKKLELKLQRLDNERTQITTEMDALKNVIKTNIEGTYKTFSG